MCTFNSFNLFEVLSLLLERHNSPGSNSAGNWQHCPRPLCPKKASNSALTRNLTVLEQQQGPLRHVC